MKTVVIFGGSGFVGQNIIRRLAKKGYRIVVPYQLPNNEAKLRLFGGVGQVVPLKFSHLSEKIIQNTIYESHSIINLKTIWQENKSYSYKNNILNFNIELVDLIKSIDQNKLLIFFSGLGVSKTSTSKRSQFISKTEHYIIENSINNSIIKPGIIIGEGDQFFNKLLPILKFSFFIPLFGSGEKKIQPVFVDDIAKAIEIIIDQDLKGKHIYELAGYEIFTYKSFYKFITDCLKIKRFFIQVPFGLAIKVASLIEKTPFDLITKDQLLLFGEDNIISNIHKNFTNLSLSPRNIREIIRKKLLQ